MEVLNLTFKEVRQRVTAVEVRGGIERRRAVWILAGVAMERCSRWAEVIVLDGAVGRAVGDGLVVRHALTEEADFDRMRTPHLGEIVANARLELLEIER